MLTGMTGFARASCQVKDTHFNLEVRSLNHRYLDCLVHSPDGFGELEDFIKAQVRARINRGRITVVLTIANLHPKVNVDYALGENYVRKLKELGHKLKLEDNLSLSQIINLEGILKLEKTPLTPEFIQAIKMLADRTLEKLAAIRQKEGRAVSADILRRLGVIRNEADRIRQGAKVINAQKKNILSHEEYSVFLKSTDIAEELTRISYHLKNFLTTIKKSTSSGKELDFIAQEVQREANTISAKAQNAAVSASIVKIKSAIEQIREQAQNVE